MPALRTGRVGPPVPPVRARTAAPRPSCSGSALLVVAGAVFTAVVWARLGAISQAVLAFGVTVGIGVLAIGLRSRLAGTAEALAAVAAALALVDLMAAPTLGLLPEHWLTTPTLYPAVAVAGLAAVLLGLHARLGLRAWAWAGWLLVPLAAGLVVAVAGTTRPVAWTAATLALPAAVSVGLLAAAGRIPAGPEHRTPMRTAGAVGLAVTGLVTAGTVANRPALPGVVVATALTAVAVGLWARLEATGRDDRVQPESPVTLARLLCLATAAIAGASVGLLLAIPADPQPLWLAAATALAGVVAGSVGWVGQLR